MWNLDKVKFSVNFVLNEIPKSEINKRAFKFVKIQLYEAVLTAVADNCPNPHLLAREVLKLKNES